MISWCLYNRTVINIGTFTPSSLVIYCQLVYLYIFLNKKFEIVAKLQKKKNVDFLSLYSAKSANLRIVIFCLFLFFLFSSLHYTMRQPISNILRLILLFMFIGISTLFWLSFLEIWMLMLALSFIFNFYCWC